MKRAFKYIISILVLTFLSGYFLRGNIIYEEFESTKWKEWTETDYEMSFRWNMMNSLRKKHELVGRYKSDIIELLGEPDDGKYNLRFRYYLGMAKRGIDTGSLVINFNEKGRVTDFYVWQG